MYTICECLDLILTQPDEAKEAEDTYVYLYICIYICVYI
jgi:hypothetical protein